MAYPSPTLKGGHARELVVTEEELGLILDGLALGCAEAEREAGYRFGVRDERVALAWLGRLGAIGELRARLRGALPAMKGGHRDG